jgi:hypothetical protein
MLSKHKCFCCTIFVLCLWSCCILSVLLFTVDTCFSLLFGGTQWHSWLRHCATSQKGMGSIPDDVTGIFIDIILPAALWPWVPGIIPGGTGCWCAGMKTLPPWCADCLVIWEPQPPGTLRACPGLWWDCFLLFITIYKYSYLYLVNFLIFTTQLYKF